ncbi:MAG: adenylosuccinate lyase [Oscillospiraceae bacterium]|nr:adenylosuccinate lyase [Oscillospiraceae bacterium]
MYERYESPLASRYASEFMLSLFSPQKRVETWRRLWVALARAEHELGLPITQEQVRELEDHVSDIDFACAAQREKEVRHDVMAHIYAYGKAAPSAAGIIHLGATSCYVTDNGDLILYREALRYLRSELLQLLKALAVFADRYKATPTLGYTHYQPAQLVTVGKRASLWMQDFLSDLEDLDHVLSTLPFLGCRGTTGTEASFLDLFDGDQEKIDELNRRIAASFDFHSCFPVCGQTYPRKLDSRILSCLSGIAQSAYRMAQDIRLLQHDRQLEEPFEDTQIGSSAMAYKRNPMRCERICSLSRYLMTEAMNAPLTASAQWLERTLDDSANRRLSMPESFLCADAVLRLLRNVSAGLRVNEKIIDRTVREYLPFIATENLLMEAVRRGGDRQQLHEVIRRCSMEATARMKEGGDCDLLSRLAACPEFGMTEDALNALLVPEDYIGRCPQQVDSFLAGIAPLLEKSGQEESPCPPSDMSI